MVMGYLEEHLKKYPLMQIEDKIKLLMQGTLGPAHLINDKDHVRKRIYAEYEQIKDLEYEYELVEHISDKFVRIYLKPYYERFETFDNLIEVFFKSCDNISDLYYLEKDLIKLKETETPENKQAIDNYFYSGDILISHSNIYKDNYHPHYLVINKRYLSILNIEK
jgi:hypothetical protein